MADNRKRLSELPSSTNIDGLYTLGVDAQNEGVKIPLGEIINSVKQPATNAQTAANNAVKTANEAKTMAQTAQTTANTAKTTADEAKSQAENAQGNANIAIENAGTAISTANEALEKAGEAITAAGGTSTRTQEIVKPRLFVNASHLLNLTGTTTLAEVLALINAHKDAELYKIQGVVITFRTETGWESWQYTFWLRQGMMLPQYNTFTATQHWRKFGGSATVGNCYNVTVDEPKAQGYYTLEEAIAKTYEKGYTNIGIQVTFSIADKS